MGAVRTAALGLVLALAVACGQAGATSRIHRVENRAAGYTIALPPGWHMSVLNADYSARIATYPVVASGDLSASPPRGQTWMWLVDEGPLWSNDGARRYVPLPASLPRLENYEGFGPARRIDFRLDGHAFLAFVKGKPRNDALRILASIRVTSYGRKLANVHTVRRIGRSVERRPIRAWRMGNPRSARRVLVVGCIHGDESAGTAITAQLVNLARPITFDLWIVQDLNPDGLARDTRQNAHGVDLNRNFGSMWRRIGRPGSLEYSGPRPWSERETRIARSLILRVHPDVGIWFHQPEDLVRAWGRSIPAARRYARLAHTPFRALRWPDGTAPNWQNHHGMVSFVVELPPGKLSLPAARRYANAILRLTQ